MQGSPDGPACRAGMRASNRAADVREANMATKTWTDGSADWYTAADWNGGLPVAGDDVVINTGVPFLQSGDTSAIVKSITLGASGTVQLNGTAALTATGDFANSGALNLDTNSGDGGGSLTIGGTLNNTKTVQVGSGFSTLSAATALTLGGLSNQRDRKSTSELQSLRPLVRRLR